LAEPVTGLGELAQRPHIDELRADTNDAIVPFFQEDARMRSMPKTITLLDMEFSPEQLQAWLCKPGEYSPTRDTAYLR
jgi:hypothetical protein